MDLTVLFVFKYLGFFTENLNRLPFVRLPVPQITLPIGISFFTFQAISYVVDVYRGEAAQKSLWDVMLYIAFFPQLLPAPSSAILILQTRFITDRKVCKTGIGEGIASL